MVERRYRPRTPRATAATHLLRLERRLRATRLSLAVWCGGASCFLSLLLQGDAKLKSYCNAAQTTWACRTATSGLRRLSQGSAIWQNFGSDPRRRFFRRT